MTKVVSSRDEVVYGEHVANKWRTSRRSCIEISLAQREIDVIFLKIEVVIYRRVGGVPKAPLHVKSPQISSSPSPFYILDTVQSLEI